MKLATAQRLASLTLVAACAATSLGCQDPVGSSGALATGQQGVTGIAVDGFFVYMTFADGSIKRVSLDGGAVTTVATGPKGAHHPRLDSDHVYWAASGGVIARAPKAGGAIATLTNNQPEITDIALGDDHVFFTSTKAGEVRRVVKVAGAEEDQVESVASSQSGPGPMAQIEGGVFWGNLGDGVTGSITRLSLANEAQPEVIVSESSPSAIGVASTRLFWKSAGAGEVAWSELGGGEAHVVASGQAYLGEVAGDDRHVYWSGADGKVSFAPLAGGEPEVISSGSAGTVSLTLDVATLYWANSEDGAVITRPKPSSALGE